MAHVAAPGAASLQLQNINSPHQQADFPIANPPYIFCRSNSLLTQGTSSSEFCPLTHHAFCDDSAHELNGAGSDADDVDRHRTQLADEDGILCHVDSNVNVQILHIGNSHDDGATCARLHDSKTGTDMFNLHVIGEVNESFKARKQQKLSHFNSNLYPYGQSSCHENQLLQRLCNEGHLDRAMDALFYMHTSPSTDSYLSLLRLCHKTKSLAHVKDVCTHLVQHRTELNGYLGDFLVTTLANCGAVEDAQEIANRLARRTVFSWTAIISAYVNRGEELKALKFYECMQKEGVEPDTFTFVSLFKACANIQDLASGKSIHEEACKKGLEAENFVGNSIVSMYGKCGAIFEAENVFMALSYRDIVSWTTMLSAYQEQGQSKRALQTYRQMQEEGLNPNYLTCVIALQACVSFAETEAALEFEGWVKVVSLELGQALHAYARRKDLESDAFVNTTLLNLYGNCGSIRMAENVLSMLSYKSVVSWNAMLAAYVDQSCGEEALLLFRIMLEEGTTPDPLTYVSAVQACSIIAEKEAANVMKECSNRLIALKIGHALHTDVCMNNFESDAFVATALVAMYGKCGCIEEAETVFNSLSNHDLVSWMTLFSAYVGQGQGEKALRLHREMQKQQFVLDDFMLMLSWTAMLSGFIAQEQGEKALELYRQMQEKGVMLDDVALNCALQACCLTGSLESCRDIHCRIVCTGYDLSHSISTTLIRAYGNCASMVDAQVTFDKRSEPDMAAWSACIAGYAGEGNATACICMFEKLIKDKIIPDDLTFSSVLSVCCHAGLVARGLELFECMSKDFGVAPGLKHYGIMIDILGRAGDFNRIMKMLDTMPLQPDLTIWMCVLGACQTHDKMELAKLAFDNAVTLQPMEEAAYALMSNICAEAGMQECTSNIEI